MVTLDQIKLLETKITKAVNFVSQLTDENNELKRRNEELEETIAVLKDEKNRVQEGIISALGKLNQFEDAIERSISSVKSEQKSPQNDTGNVPSRSAEQSKPAQPRPAEQPVPAVKPQSSLPSVTIPSATMPSAYLVDEEPEEESSEAELDIF